MIRAALVVVVFTSLVVAASAEPTTKRIESADHRVAVEVPAAWTVERRESDHAALSLRVAATDACPAFDVDVFHTVGFLDPRCQAYVAREMEAERFDGAAKGEVVVDPLPRLVMNVVDEKRPVVRAWFYRVLDRNGFTLTVRCQPAAWPAIASACGDVAASLTSAVPEWPERPAGYVASERDGYEYLVQPGVAPKDVETLAAALLDAEKAWTKTHAPVPKPRDRRPVVIVSADAEGSRVAAGAAKAEGEFVAHVVQGRMFAVPLRKDDARQRAALIRAAGELFHAQTFGAEASPWLLAGESRFASGDDLPLPKEMGRFDELIRSPGRGAAEQATVYVALFLRGAKPWRDAYAAFLKDLAATGDWRAAETKHLLTLDQEKLRAAAQALVKAAKSK